MLKHLVNHIIAWLCNHRIMSMKWICFIRYFLKFKKWPNMKRPRSLNEKLLWLEFNTDTSKWTELSDKYLVRKYIQDKIGNDYLVKLYGVYDTPPTKEDIEKLPKSFVIKTNNGYGTVLLIKDKNSLNVNELDMDLSKWLKEPFGYLTGEPHYTRIIPKIIIEELLPIDKSVSSSLVDYKFWCLNGKPYCCFVCANRSIKKHTADFCVYDIPSWKRREDVMTSEFKNDVVVPKPENLDEMMRCAELLSKDFPLVRVDFYDVNGKIYFGEMTFTSNGGRMAYFTQSYLNEMGDALILPMKN